MPATQNPNVDLPEVEDESTIAEGTDYGTLRSAGAKLIGGFVKARDAYSGASYAGAFLLGIIAMTVRDAAGFPAWSKADWPEAANKLYAGMLEDAGLSEDDGKSFIDAVRSRWSRSTGAGNVRDAFIVAHVLDTVEGAKVNGTAEVSTQEANAHAAALKILGPDLSAMLPEVLRDGPFNVTNVNAACKRGCAEQLRHYKLTVPVKFGGEPKDSGDTSAKLPASAETVLTDTAIQSVSGHVGTEGGPSFLSVANGSLAVDTAFASEIITATDGITDREKVRETVQRHIEVLQIAAKYLDSKGTEKDAERLSAVGFLPESDN